MSPAHGTVQPSSPAAQPAGVCGWALHPRPCAGHPRPFGPENPDCNPPGHPEEDASASTLRQGGTARPSTSKVHGHGDCESSILGCVLPSLSAAAGRPGDSGDTFPRELSTRSLINTITSFAPRSQASSLFASLTPQAIYPLVLAHPTYSFSSGRCISSPRLFLRDQNHSSSILSICPSEAVSRTRTIPFNRPRIKQRSCDLSKFIPELPNHHSTPAVDIWRPRGSPPPHLSVRLHHPRSWSRITPTSCALSPSPRLPSRDHFFPKNPEFFPIQILN